MNQARLYYTAPSDDIFNRVKACSIIIWSRLGSEPSYADEKIGAIRNIENVSDNLMYMVAMFDINNQRKLAALLDDKDREAIRARMIDGGQPTEYIVF